MNRENALKWVEALRSGKYTQGTHKLKSGVGVVRHCCLGVAAELARIDVPAREEGMQAPIYRQVAEWLGLPIEPKNPMSDFDSEAFSASKMFQNMNDLDGRSFAQIADFVESELAREAA
jgi:hypothetical protein